jgi:hypothetical protein
MPTKFGHERRNRQDKSRKGHSLARQMPLPNWLKKKSRALKVKGKKKRRTTKKHPPSDFALCVECGCKVLHERMESHLHTVHGKQVHKKFQECLDYITQ